jgi:acyl carrier protein
MSNYLAKVKSIIEHKFGVDAQDITPEAFFEEDLNISEMELIDLLGDLEEEFDVDLIENRSEIESVGDLLEILSERLD